MTSEANGIMNCALERTWQSNIDQIPKISKKDRSWHKGGSAFIPTISRFHSHGRDSRGSKTSNSPESVLLWAARKPCTRLHNRTFHPIGSIAMTITSTRTAPDFDAMALASCCLTVLSSCRMWSNCTRARGRHRREMESCY